jgi:hypothetical protein
VDCATYSGAIRDFYPHIRRSAIVNASATDLVTRDLRGQAFLRVNGRKEHLIVSCRFRIYSGKCE